MASKSYNVGIIGYGASAKVFHIPLIEVVPELKFYAIVQRHPKPENDATKAHPGVKSFRAAEDMVKDNAVDIVVVTTTPASHFELTKLALENGKHVMVEKPFVPTSKEADDLIALAKKYGKLLTVYQNRRYDSDFRTIQDLLQNNTLGRIVEFESHFDRYKPSLAGSKAWKTRPEPGGGAVYDLGTHMIDQVVHVFGLPKRVTAFLGSQRIENPNNYDDTCTVLLHYDGMVATVKAAVVSAEEKQMRFWVRGEKGSYKKVLLAATFGELMSIRPGEPGFGMEPEEHQGTLTTVGSANEITAAPYPTIQPLPYSTIYSEFVNAITTGGPVPVRPEDARAVIRIIELAKQSSDEGRTMVVDA
ncbi:MAG: hypothetical protein Q9220_002226 [cf. Caloplaca sp. 1 TL-2023]